MSDEIGLHFSDNMSRMLHDIGQSNRDTCTNRIVLHECVSHPFMFKKITDTWHN